MLIPTHSIFGTSVEGTDAIAGTIRDLLFDDRTWAVRHLVVHSGNWMTGQSELLAPSVIRDADWHGGRVNVAMSREQVEHSPGADTVTPASRQRDDDVAKVIAWEAFWTGILEESGGREVDPHLNSVKEVTGYHIDTLDGSIGHVEDFIVDDRAWMIRYLVVDTRNWLPGKHVLLSPMSVGAVHWYTRRIHVDLSRETIQTSPEYDRTVPISQAYEEKLHEYYGLPRYWTGAPAGT